MNAARIQVIIDGLVLRGIDPADRPHLVAALRTELGRVLSNPETRAAWSRSGKTPVLRLGNIPFAPGPAGSRNLGRKIAQAVAGRGAPAAGRLAP